MNPADFIDTKDGKGRLIKRIFHKENPEHYFEAEFNDEIAQETQKVFRGGKIDMHHVRRYDPQGRQVYFEDAVKRSILTLEYTETETTYSISHTRNGVFDRTYTYPK